MTATRGDSFVGKASAHEWTSGQRHAWPLNDVKVSDLRFCRIHEIEMLINKVKWPVFVQVSLSSFSFVLLTVRRWKTKCKVSIFSAGTWSTQMDGEKQPSSAKSTSIFCQSRFCLPYSLEKRSQSLFLFVLCRIQWTDEHDCTFARVFSHRTV